MTSNLKFQEWMLVSLQSVSLGVLPSDPLFWEQKHVGRGDSVSLWSPPSSQSHCHLATAAFASSSPNWLWPHAHPESVSALECWPEGTPRQAGLWEIREWKKESGLWLWGTKDHRLVCGRRGNWISRPERHWAGGLGERRLQAMRWSPVTSGC